MEANRYCGYKKILMITLLIVVWAASFGGDLLSYNDPRLDISENPVYEVIDPDAAAKAFEGEYNETADRYKGRFVIFNAEVISAESRKLTVATAGGLNLHITLAEAKEAENAAAHQSIAVFGQLETMKVKPFFSINKGHISALTISPRQDYYAYMGGQLTGYSKDRSIQKSLAGGLTYRIPSSWEKAQCTEEERKEIFNSKLLHNSDCYILDKNDFFIIFYFDKEEFLLYDSNYSADSAIRSSIITNICPGDSGVWLRNLRSWPVKSDFGRSYEYYVSVYKDHRVEFVFTPVGDDICVMMYVTDGKYTYAPDAMYIQRTVSSDSSEEG